MSDQRSDRKRARRAAYYAEHRDEQLTASRVWKAANPDRAREHNRVSMRRAYQRRKAAERRRQAARERYAANRDRERERSRQYRINNPDRMREYKQRFRERHPERVAEQNRRSNRAWRDRNADRLRETNKDRATVRRQEDPDAYRRWYAANREQQRARGREASRLRSRLKKLGLPPRRIHRVYAADKRANAAAADAFFTRPPARTGPVITGGDPAALHPERLDARRRVMEKMTAGYAKRRAADAALLRLPGHVETHRARHGVRVREEVRMDSIARQLRGKPPLDIDNETDRRIWRTVASEHAPRVDPARIERIRTLTARHRASTSPHTDAGLIAELTSVNQSLTRATQRGLPRHDAVATHLRGEAHSRSVTSRRGRQL